MNNTSGSTIKVTMLGNTGSGKTCYLAAMYQIMSMGFNLNGFSLKAKTRKNMIELEETWRLLAEGNENNERIWPEGTDTTQFIDFSLKYALREDVAQFEWYDYRGGILLDPDEEKEDVKDLLNRIGNTSCLLLCVSGEHFSESGLAWSAKRKIGVTAMNDLISLSSSYGNNIPPSIVIALTKYDQCKHRNKEEIFEEIKHLFSPLFAKTKWLVAICPVTLGISLSKDQDGASLFPRNVSFPVVFSLLAELLKQHWEIEESNIDVLPQTNLTRILDIKNIVRLFKNKGVLKTNNSHEENLLIAAKLRGYIKGLSNIAENNNDLDFFPEIYFDGKEINLSTILESEGEN
jgi:hypothetical protein